MKSKPKVLTFSHQKKGHGTLPRHERMAIALKKKGFDVIWVSPKGYENKNFKNINLLIDFIPNFLFFTIYLKLFITCLINIKTVKNIDYVLAIREYDAISLFFNPFFKKSKKIFFSRGDVISILKINLPDRNFFQAIKDRIIIYIYPFFQRIIYKKADMIIFQAQFLRNLFLKRINLSSIKSKILPNECNNKKLTYKNRIIKEEITLGFAAPMYWSCKGLGVIVNLYKSLVKRKVNFKLFIAGKGPQSYKLIEKLSKISKQNFVWKGWVDNIYSFFNQIDLLIIPSKYDSCPNLLLEGLNSNKMIFASNIAAHKEIIKNKELIFSINNIDLLVKKIIKLKKSKKYQYKIKSIVLNTRKKNQFNWDKNFYRLIKKC